MGAAGALGSATGLALALVLTLLGVRIRPLYVIAGGAAFLGAAACVGIPRRIKAPGPRFVFRRRYARYYVLNFLEGWRKQIAIAFGGFLLVKIHHAGLLEILILAAVIQAIGYFTSPRVGKLIDRVGERRVLIFYYAFVTVMFLGYAFLQGEVHPLRGVRSGQRHFRLQHGAHDVREQDRPAERAPTDPQHGCRGEPRRFRGDALSGGILWTTLGYQWAFLVGIPAAAASIAIVSRMPRGTQLVREERPPG